MIRLLSTIAAILLFHTGFAQITITAADMPVAGDTLRFSNASPVGSAISPGDSGVNVAWNYSLTPVSQGVDTYQTATQVNLLYALTVGLTAFGYKVADSLPGLGGGGGLPISVHQIYTFFEEKTGPSRFEAYAFAANISGLPAAFDYTIPDVWYYFPLTYLNSDSSAYALNISLDTIAGIKESGTRQTRVDGWGTITTPYYTTPVNCIRVRSVINEIDSVSFGGFTFPVPNNTVQYKWLANGEHFPALWVTSNLLGGTEVISSIQYRDSYRNLDTSTNIDNAAPAVSKINTQIKAFPNPASGGVFNLDIPDNWNNYFVQVFSQSGTELMTVSNQKQIDIHSFPSGQYLVRIICGGQTAYVPIVR